MSKKVVTWCQNRWFDIVWWCLSVIFYAPYLTMAFWTSFNHPVLQAAQHQGLDTFSSQQLATITWAFAKAGASSTAAVLQDLAEAAAPKVQRGDCKVQDLSNLAWAFGRLQQKVPQLLAAFSKILPPLDQKKRKLRLWGCQVSLDLRAKLCRNQMPLNLNSEVDKLTVLEPCEKSETARTCVRATQNAMKMKHSFWFLVGKYLLDIKSGTYLWPKAEAPQKKNQKKPKKKPRANCTVTCPKGAPVDWGITCPGRDVKVFPPSSWRCWRGRWREWGASRSCHCWPRCGAKCHQTTKIHGSFVFLAPVQKHWTHHAGKIWNKME